jgi:hypothetical protein
VRERKKDEMQGGREKRKKMRCNHESKKMH